MTQENKEILLKDLCTRLPYGVKGIIMYDKSNTTFTVEGIDNNILHLSDAEECYVEDFKPYLRPMSSMTEEECDMIEEILGDNCIFDFMSNGDIILKQGQFSQKKLAKLYDYYNSIHIDYRGLISMGLALEAPEGMYTLNK